MKRTEKLIAAIATVAVGILLIVLKEATVQIITSIVGVLLIVLGVLDWISRDTRFGALKILIGIALLAFGWLVDVAVLYIAAICLFIVAIWWIYELWRTRLVRSLCGTAVFLYAQPVLLLLIGLFLLFHQLENSGWVFITAGILTTVEGAMLFASAVKTIE